MVTIRYVAWCGCLLCLGLSESDFTIAIISATDFNIIFREREIESQTLTPLITIPKKKKQTVSTI